jgi:hypothetical protein
VRAPTRIRFTRHARIRVERRRLSLNQVETIVLEAHGRRTRNQGRADWRLVVGEIVVLYDWPAAGDESLALVRSVWRR